MVKPVLLLVEDSPDDEALARRALRRSAQPVDLTVARDGLEAVTTLGLLEGEGADHQPLPSLVLLDVKLPRMNGHEVLQLMRENARTREVPVVVLSSSDEPSDVRRASEMGVMTYLRKPVDYDEYLNIVSTVVQNHIH
jgi:two-component system response regulator